VAGEVLGNRFGPDVDVEVSCPVYPSEDPSKVLAMVDLVFGTSSRTAVSASGGRVQVVYAGDQALSKVYEQVRSRMTVSVLRRLLRQRRQDSSTSFLLNKQVAARGVVVLCETEAESPLGPVTVVIRTRELDRFIDWMAPDLRRQRRSFRKG